MKKVSDMQQRPRLGVIGLYLVLPLLFGFMTTLFTGYGYGIINNVFHIPYVLNLANTPEFKDDAYYATLKNMTSIIWPIMRLLSTEANVERIFYVAFIISDALAYAGILYLIRISGLRSISENILAMTVLMLSPFLRYTSIIGNCGMFIDYFNHSEITWIFVFLSIGLLSRGKIIAAYAMVGIAFSINAFIGIWLLFINTFTLLFSGKKEPVVTYIKALVGFALFALPVILWIYFAISAKSEVVNFKFIEYIRHYFPDHFLIEASNLDSFITHVMLVCSGVLAALHMPNRRFWVLVQIGAFLIILMGIPAPYIFDNRFVFNLHLLRSAGVGQAIAAILITISGVKLFLEKTDRSKRNLGIVIILSMFIVYDLRYLGMTVIMMSLMVSNLWEDLASENGIAALYYKVSKYRDKLVILCGLLFILVLIKNIVQNPFDVAQLLKTILILLVIVLMFLNNIKNKGIEKYVAIVFLIYAFSSSIIAVKDRTKLEISTDQMPQNRSWRELVIWIRTSSLHGPFLLPSNDRDHTDYFQLQARKKVWVDWKQGAAVMWSPSFYEQWSTRSREVSELRTNEDYISYAKEHGIKYVVLSTTDGVCPLPAKVLKRTSYYILCGLE
jgi:hypothetical protein